jgi:hypothetical protein
MSRSQVNQRRAKGIAGQRASTDASANQPAPYITTADSAKNIAGDVVDFYYPDRAPIGGGIEDPRSPKPQPLSGPNASY